ncbi:646_t:CDS:2, partial [Cetraspora pellucida]
IMHAIKQYVCIEYDVVKGSDIMTATKNLAETYLAKTIAGISKYNFWQWPIAGPLAGYIVACLLPHFGASIHFSPAMITSLYFIDTARENNTEKGWVLHKNIVYSNRDRGKRITAKDMYVRLKEFANNSELEQDEVPKVSTIQGWISRYYKTFLDQATRTALQSNLGEDISEGSI